MKKILLLAHKYHVLAVAEVAIKNVPPAVEANGHSVRIAMVKDIFIIFKIF